MTMVERVGAAIRANISPDRDGDVDDDDWGQAARAAIEAMREPNAKIIAKCRADWPTFNGVIFKDYWARYLDAALSEGEG